MTRLHSLCNIVGKPFSCRSLLPVFLSVFTAAAVFAAETPPKLMTLQSYISDDTGTPLGNVTPVNKAIQFIMFTAEEGGESVFAESQTVTVDKGYFSAILGEGTAISGEAKHDLSTAFTGSTASDRYIEIQVETDSGDFQILSPRLRVLPNAYAFLAGYANVAGRVDAGSIDSTAIAASAVGSSQVDDNSLTQNDLATNSVGVDEIAANAVGSSEIINRSIRAGDIAEGNVTSYEIANRTISSADIAQGGVGTYEIADGNVTSADIANNAVSSTKILDDTITSADIKNRTIFWDDIAQGAVGSYEIAQNITLAGKVGVNYRLDDTAFSVFEPTNTGWIARFLNADFTTILGVHTSGAVITYFGTVTTSDRRSKENIEPVGLAALPGILKLEAKRYRYKEMPDSGTHLGFIAQDVQEIFPEVVDDGMEYLALNYQELGVLAIEGIKELNTEVEALEAENKALSARLAALETLVQSLVN